MTKKLKILIACGSGIATSTIASNEIKEICLEKNIPVDIFKCSMTELSSYENKVDIIFTTNNYKGNLSVPNMCVTGFITGINIDTLKEEVILKLKSLQS